MDREDARALNEWASREYRSTMDEMARSSVLGPLLPSAAPKYRYAKVESVGIRHEPDDGDYAHEAASALTGLFSAGIPWSVAYVGDGKEVSLYLGTEDDQQLAMLLRLLGRSYTTLSFDGPRQAEVSVYDQPSLGVTKHAHSGIVKGCPLPHTGTAPGEAPIDVVIRCMAGRRWCLQLFARPEDASMTLGRQKRWLDRATRVSTAAVDVTFTTSDGAEGTSFRQRYADSERYAEVVDAFCAQSRESVSLGEWCVTVNYSATTAGDAALLGGVLVAAFHGDGTESEPLHAISRRAGESTPVVDGWECVHDAYLGGEAPFPRYATLLSSQELSAFLALPTADTAGIAVRSEVDFDVCREGSGELDLGEILDCERRTGTQYSLSPEELSRHALIVGLTGSGKTNTVKAMLRDLAAKRELPWMVIEPAKKEYWELWRMGIDGLQVYGVGSTDPCVRTLCINPFQRASALGPDGVTRSVPIQTHIDIVNAAFKAAFIMYTPMPYVLERVIYEVYEDCGWDIAENVNRHGKEVYPTIEDLYLKIPQVVEAMGYDQRMRRDLIGSLQARINSLRIGSKGAALNVESSLPFDRLLEGQVVVELEDIGDDEAKAFVISILLINLLEVRRAQPDSQLVRHVMVVEEAHRLLRNVRGGTGEDADPRAAAVESFCNLLAEVRSKGQGIVIAEQTPSKLAPDVVKNTNTKVAHRLVDREERSLIGGSMNMTDGQADALATLRRGVAAVYSEGDFRPKLVASPRAADWVVPGREGMPREAALSSIGANHVGYESESDHIPLTGRKTEVCRRCAANCRRDPRKVLGRIPDDGPIDQLAAGLDPRRTKSCVARDVDKGIRDMLDTNLPGWERHGDRAVSCTLRLLLDRWQLPERMEQRIIDACFKLQRHG